MQKNLHSSIFFTEKVSEINIEHTGRIKEKQGNKLIVSIIPNSACAACDAKGICSESSTTEKLIEVTDFTGNYKVGETVDVFYAQSLGFRALFLGYVLPFLILLVTLIISFSITRHEGISGLLSLAVLVPYYAILYFTKDKIRKTFSFQIKPKNIFKGVHIS